MTACFSSFFVSASVNIQVRGSRRHAGDLRETSQDDFGRPMLFCSDQLLARWGNVNMATNIIILEMMCNITDNL